MSSCWIWEIKVLLVRLSFVVPIGRRKRCKDYNAAKQGISKFAVLEQKKCNSLRVQHEEQGAERKVTVWDKRLVMIETIGDRVYFASSTTIDVIDFSGVGASLAVVSEESVTVGRLG